MPPQIKDRRYGQQREGLAFHAVYFPGRAVWNYSICNIGWLFEVNLTKDRLPPDAHLCGNCARIIAAMTDEEAKS